MANLIHNIFILLIIFTIVKIVFRNKFNNNKILFISCVIFSIYYLSGRMKVEKFADIIYKKDDIVDKKDDIVDKKDDIVDKKVDKKDDKKDDIVDKKDDKKDDIVDKKVDKKVYKDNFNNKINEIMNMIDKSKKDQMNNMNENNIKLNNQLYKVIEIMNKSNTDEINNIKQHFDKEMNKLKREMRTTNHLYSSASGDWKENY